MNVLGVIPARGGSVGILRKNVYPLKGKPLIAYAIQAAKLAHSLTRVIVSTDNEEIAQVARDYGADVPFMRPTELAQSETPTVPVIEHALKMLEPIQFEVVVVIQPTAPLRLAEDIDNAVGLLTEKFDSVVSVAEVPHQFNPNWIHRIEDHTLHPYIENGPLKYTRRQDLPSVYYRNGAVYVTRCSSLATSGNLYGQYTAAYIMPPERSVNIDSISDIWLAEYFLSQL